MCGIGSSIKNVLTEQHAAFPSVSASFPVGENHKKKRGGENVSEERKLSCLIEFNSLLLFSYSIFFSFIGSHTDCALYLIFFTRAVKGGKNSRRRPSQQRNATKIDRKTETESDLGP